MNQRLRKKWRSFRQGPRKGIQRTFFIYGFSLILYMQLL